MTSFLFSLKHSLHFPYSLVLRQLKNSHAVVPRYPLGCWFQEPPLIPKSRDAQVPHVKRCSTVGTVGLPCPWVLQPQIQPTTDQNLVEFLNVKSAETEGWLYFLAPQRFWSHNQFFHKPYVKYKDQTSAWSEIFSNTLNKLGKSKVRKCEIGKRRTVLGIVLKTRHIMIVQLKPTIQAPRKAGCPGSFRKIISPVPLGKASYLWPPVPSSLQGVQDRQHRAVLGQRGFPETCSAGALWPQGQAQVLQGQTSSVLSRKTNTPPDTYQIFSQL